MSELKAMTVQQLIDYLLTIEDKSKVVEIGTTAGRMPLKNCEEMKTYNGYELVLLYPYSLTELDLVAVDSKD
jgi:hypothetical protein